MGNIKASTKEKPSNSKPESSMAIHKNLDNFSSTFKILTKKEVESMRCNVYSYAV